MLELEVEPRHLDPLMALADTFFAELDPEVIKDKLPSSFPMDRLEEYCKIIPSRIPGFREEVATTTNNAGYSASRMLLIILTLLGSRVTSPVLTGSLLLLTEMNYEQKADVLRRWRDSPIAALRKLYKSFFSLTGVTFSMLAPELHHLAIGYPGRESREFLFEEQKIDDFEYTMMERVKSDGAELYMPNIDALIIGSGSGAGVVAHTLQNEGFNCLVLEKGKYYPPKAYVFDDFQGVKALYEGGGKVVSTNQELFLLAGSTFGGGSTVNWSACLKTPFKVRKEWYDDFGVEFAANETFDECLEYVWKQMGASTEGIEHSHSNKALLEGANKLGYHSSAINQNSGSHKNHDCGFCYLGCKYGIKQGSQACWFRDAADKGCQFLDQVRVEQIEHKGGKAVGVSCVDITTGYTFRITGPKRIIVSGGSFHTPILLQKSGFKNRHIGKNLKLHPVTTLLAFYDNVVDTEPYKHAIMTAVSNQAADLDGKAHGPRIETILHAPFIEGTFFPWDGAAQMKADLLRYNKTSAMLIITRDKGSGQVSYDVRRPDAPIVNYSVSKFDANALLEGYLVAADISYIYGATELTSSQGWTPRFKSSKPTHERSITDKDYVEWRKKVQKLGFSQYGPSYGSAHQMSSCRMSGKGPKYGAVDLKGRLFECKNLYVADASVFPTASGANPMITTMTMARHIALDIVNDLKSVSRL